MPKREVDKRKTAKALRKLRKVVERTQASDAPKLTAWEQDFVSGVSQRLETYGSAFRDLSKGRAEEALSMRQSEVARVIDKKSRPKVEKPPKGKTANTDDRPARTDAGVSSGEPAAKSAGLRRTPFRNKATTSRGPRVRDINDDPEQAPQPPRSGPALVEIPRGATPTLRHTTESPRNPSPAPQKSAPNTTPHHTPAAPRKAGGRPSLRLIPGGKADD